MEYKLVMFPRLKLFPENKNKRDPNFYRMDRKKRKAAESDLRNKAFKVMLDHITQFKFKITESVCEASLLEAMIMIAESSKDAAKDKTFL